MHIPSRNILKLYAAHSYYHVDNRGVEKRDIFKDDHDYQTFLNLLKRYLSPTSEPDSYGRDGVTLYGNIELLVFCLLPNQYRLLIYINENPKAMTEIIRRVCTAYTMYFNKKYDRVGSLFQGRYKASKINSNEHLLQISRYIHRNPQGYYNWPYSSYPYYIKGWYAEWVRPDNIYALYEWGTYEQFVNDWNDESYDKISEYLADI